jgi:hypothetical protein
MYTLYVCMYVCVCVCICVCMYIYIYSTYVCIYLYTYAYVCTPQTRASDEMRDLFRQFTIGAELNLTKL